MLTFPMVTVKELTSTKGSHSALSGFGAEDSSAIPVGGPRKPSQTSLKRDSSASLQSRISYSLAGFKSLINNK